MDSSALFDPPADFLDANLRALRARNAALTSAIESAQPPPSIRAATARDGGRSFCWTEGGRTNWLGRTSLPTVRSQALVDAFQPGSGNVLLVGFGQGAEVRLLLDRLLEHQAVFVIEECPWAAKLVLRLHDFSRDVEAGRLVLLNGPDAWDQYRRFLLQHDGYLVPERILSWPYFSTATAMDISSRVSLINSGVEAARAENFRKGQESGAMTTKQTGDAASAAIICNQADSACRRLAADLAAAARRLGYTPQSFVPDSPRLMHPLAVARTLASARPRFCLLIDCLPATLPYSLPDAPLFIVCSHDKPLAEEWLRNVPSGARLGVRTASQKLAAQRNGIDAGRLHLLLPATGRTGPPVQTPSMSTQIAVLADLTDPSPEAAGLHLASHRRLWQAATSILSRRVDDYRDEMAEEVFAAAQRQAGFRIESPQVAAALIERIRQQLGPAIVRSAYCHALRAAGLEFQLCGAHQTPGGQVNAHFRPPWHTDHGPRPGDVGLVILLEPSGLVHPELLDSLAAGLPVLIRAHPAHQAADGLGGVIDTARHAWPFKSRGELVALARRFSRAPGEFQERAAAASRHVLDSHTWLARLADLLAS